MSSYYSYERPELVAEVPEGAKRVLDIGCGAGAMSAAIKRDKGSDEIWGVEIVADVAEKAKENPALDKLFVGNIEQLVHELPEEYFDCIVAGDVLEHLVDPWTTLAELRTEHPQLVWTPRIGFVGLLDVPDAQGETRAQGPAMGLAVGAMGLPALSRSRNTRPARPASKPQMRKALIL